MPDLLVIAPVHSVGFPGGDGVESPEQIRQIIGLNRGQRNEVIVIAEDSPSL